MRPVAVIPVAGAGTRLRPHTITTPKALLSVAGQPILGHILDQIAAVDPERVVLVVDPARTAIGFAQPRAATLPT